jgi:hypothetical protein
MGAFVTKRGKIDAAGWKEVLNDFFSQGTLKHEIAVGLEASLFWEEVAISIRVFKDVPMSCDPGKELRTFLGPAPPLILQCACLPRLL